MYMFSCVTLYIFEKLEHVLISCAKYLCSMHPYWRLVCTKWESDILRFSNKFARSILFITNFMINLVQENV